MKRGIHPNNNAIEARCICGVTYTTLSTSKDCVVASCASCNPYYTNSQKFADVEGRIEKFRNKYKDSYTPAPDKK